MTATATKRDAKASSRERILAVAERLIAERGVAVSLRDIAIEAGQRNNSAVNYYFGDRDGLIAEIVTYRLTSLESRRMELLAEVEASEAPDDPEALVRALVVPMFEVPRLEGATHYARFLEAVREHPAVRAIEAGAPASSAAVRIIVARLGRSLTQLPKATRDFRLKALGTMTFALLADHERMREARALSARDESDALENVVNLCVSILVAKPPGAERSESAKRAGTVETRARR